MTSNATVYWDHLENTHGPLACAPNGGDPHYAFVCSYTLSFISSMHVLIALSLFYTTYQGVRMSNKSKSGRQLPPRVANQSKGSIAVLVPRRTQTGSNVSRRGSLAQQAVWVSKFGDSLSYGAQLALVVGLLSLARGSGLILSGLGTSHSIHEFRGQVGDGCYAIATCLSWYLSLLQYRGARWFQGLIQLPGAERGTKRNARKLPSPSKVLDTIQGPLSPVIALGLWVLLLTGYLARSWFYNVSLMGTFSFGFRAFSAIVMNRAATIKRISAVQNQAPGRAADKRRRMRTLKRKTIGIVVDLVIVFLGYVALAGSFVVVGSFFSSRQAVVHYAVGESIVVLMLIATSLQMRTKVRKERARYLRVQHMRTGKSKGASAEDIAESQTSGLSVVEQSCVNGDRRGTLNSNASGAGLFSEVQSGV